MLVMTGVIKNGKLKETRVPEGFVVCKSCGALNTDGHAICTQCGKKVS